jgi:hypothetical protein
MYKFTTRPAYVPKKTPRENHGVLNILPGITENTTGITPVGLASPQKGVCS